MKGALAAQVEAGARFALTHPDHAGTLAFLITSDEEGPARQGTQEVLRVLTRRGLVITAALVGEPSSRKIAGDAIRIGRRGSLSGNVEFTGETGHVAYLPSQVNAAHALVQFLVHGLKIPALSADPAFPPVSFHITALETPGIARNVVPATARADFNFRYPPPLQPEVLQTFFESQLPHGPFRPVLTWRRSAEPFLSVAGPLREITQTVLKQRLSRSPELRVDGGTSDGRFFSRLGAEVVELGLPSERLHAPDERVALQDLEALEPSYFDIVKSYLETVGAPPSPVSGPASALRP
jgi:succinyl-diaminopimelate desuccinylase